MLAYSKHRKIYELSTIKKNRKSAFNHKIIKYNFSKVVALLTILHFVHVCTTTLSQSGAPEHVNAALADNLDIIFN